MLKLLVSRKSSLNDQLKSLIGTNLTTSVIVEPGSESQFIIEELLNELHHSNNEDQWYEIANQIMNMALISNGLEDNDFLDDPEPNFVLLDPDLSFKKYQILKQAMIGAGVFVIETDAKSAPVIDEQALLIIRDQQSKWWAGDPY